MTNFNYYEQKVCPIGSSFYYSLRYLPAKKRIVLIALQALLNELNEIVFECRETQLAQLKCHWWHNEILQTFQGVAVHPITQALQPTLLQYPALQSAFEKLLEGILFNITTDYYTDFSQLVEYCRQTTGVLQVIITHILGYRQENTLQFAEELGIALRLTEMLRSIRHDITRGRFYLPRHDLTQLNLTYNHLLNYQNPAAIKTLFAQQIQRIRQQYYSAFNYLAPTEYLSQHCQIIQAKLALATLKEIEVEGYLLLTQYTTLTPIRKLLLSSYIYWQLKLQETFAHSL